MLLTPRDREVVKFVEVFGQLSSTQIAALVFSDVTRTPLDRSLNRLSKYLLIKRIGRADLNKAGTAPFVWQLGLGGHRYLSKNGRWRQHAVQPHELSVAEVFVNLVKAQRQGKLLVDKFVKEQPIGKARADVFLVMSSPDGTKSVQLYLEIDQGWQRPNVIKAKLDAYLDAWSDSNDIMPRVKFLAMDMMRVRELRYEISQLKPEDRELFSADLLSAFPS